MVKWDSLWYFPLPRRLSIAFPVWLSSFAKSSSVDTEKGLFLGSQWFGCWNKGQRYHQNNFFFLILPLSHCLTLTKPSYGFHLQLLAVLSSSVYSLFKAQWSKFKGSFVIIWSTTISGQFYYITKAPQHNILNPWSKSNFLSNFWGLEAWFWLELHIW